MSVQVVEMDSVSLNTVARNLNEFFVFALQTALLDTTILATKATVLTLRMIADVSAWNDTKHDECITNGGFPFPKLCVVRKPELENKDASETEDDNEVDGSGGISDEEEDGEDDDEDVSGDEGEDDDNPEDGPDANGDGGSEDDDEGDDDKEYEDDEDEDEDDEEEEEEVPQPPAKKRK